MKGKVRLRVECALPKWFKESWFRGEVARVWQVLTKEYGIKRKVPEVVVVYEEEEGPGWYGPYAPGRIYINLAGRGGWVGEEKIKEGITATLIEEFIHLLDIEVLKMRIGEEGRTASGNAEYYGRDELEWRAICGKAVFGKDEYWRRVYSEACLWRERHGLEVRNPFER